MSDISRAEAIKNIQSIRDYMQDRIENETDIAFDKEQAIKDVASLDMAINSLQIDEQYDLAMEQAEPIGHCKDCKYFEYDSVAKVDGIPLIVAHEICTKWGDGCKTKEDGFCFLFEPKAESEE